MSVTVTLNFATTAEAAAFLAGNGKASAAKVETPKAETPKPDAAKAVDTSRTAEAAKADAPSKKDYNFDTDVLPALQAYSKKVSREDFAANVMKKYGINKVPELKAKPEVFAELMALCAG